jgi:hypothetical protein
MSAENEVQKMEQLKAARRGAWLLRNNSGAFKDAAGRLVRYGLGNISRKMNSVFKSADLIGIEPVLITPDMVGQTIGRFIAVECKAPGWTYTGDEREQAQQRFLLKVTELGGRAYFTDGSV